MAYVQAPGFACRDHSALCPLILKRQDLVSGSGRDDAGARCGSESTDPVPLVQRYAPALEERVRAYQGYGSTSWRVEETYIRVGGRWKYLFRAVDKHKRLIDFMLLDRRNTRAAHHFLSKAAVTVRDWPPTSITTDKCPPYPEAIVRLKRDGQFPRNTRNRTSKCPNNIIETDHGALKQVIKPTRGFQTMKTATTTIKGFKVMRMIRQGQCLACTQGVQNEVRFVNTLFQIAA
jgi:IS6 family transposase